MGAMSKKQPPRHNSDSLAWREPPIGKERGQVDVVKSNLDYLRALAKAYPRMLTDDARGRLWGLW